MRESNWINQIVSEIGEYTRINPGYSPQVLVENLKRKYHLSTKDTEKLTNLVKKELNLRKIGLAAIELNVTFNCNLNCEYCFVHRKSPLDRMNFSTAKESIDLLFEHALYPTVNITLIGGEPLLEFELIKQIVAYALENARKHNLEVTWSITTNGTLLNEEILKFFSQYKTNILLSIDGGPESHDRYRKTKSGEGTWNKIVELLPLMRKYQPWLGARMTVSTDAIDTMREDFRLLVELGFNQLIIAPAQGADCWSKDQIKRFGVSLVKILEDYRELKQKGVQIYIEDFEKGDQEISGWGCRAGATSLAVAPNGDVSPCSKMLGLTDDAGRCIVGNINEEINFELLKPFQNAISQQPEHCKSCSIKCIGGCYAVNFEQTGDHFTPSEENCLFGVVNQEIRRMSRGMNNCKMHCPGC